MKVVFYAASKPREIMLANALERGVRTHGDDFELRRSGDYGETDDGDYRKFPGPTDDTDVAVFFGVKGHSRAIYEDHRAMGKATIYLDKGYTRDKGGDGHTKYTRASVNAPSPVAYMMREKKSSRRFERLGVQLKSRQNHSGHVLFCGSSAKYHFFHRLDEPTAFARKLVRTLRGLTERHVIYRPKPSWRGAVAVPGTSMSRGDSSIQDALKSCHVLITHGSAAAMDAILAGVPALVLGDAIARPIAETDIANVEKPFWPNDKKRLRWAAAMAHCQWTKAELESGEAWEELRQEIVFQADQEAEVEAAG